jgi:hypothetical protein
MDGIMGYLESESVTKARFALFSGLRPLPMSGLYQMQSLDLGFPSLQNWKK